MSDALIDPYPVVHPADLSARNNHTAGGGSIPNQPFEDGAEARADLSRSHTGGTGSGDAAAAAAAEALADDARVLRLIAESSVEVVSRHKLDGTISYISPSVKALLGYEPEELIGKPGQTLMAADDAAVIGERDAAEFTGGEVVRFRALHKNGGERWFEATVHVLTDADAIPVETIAVSRDVTDRVLAEREARRQTEQTVRIYERISDAFFALDREWRLIYMNPIADRMRTTTRKEDVYGKVMWEVFPDLMQTKFYTEYQRAVREQVPVSLEEYWSRLDRWFEATAYPSQEGLAVFFRDVTLRKRSEEAVRESEHRFRAAFDDAPTAMSMVDLTGVIQRANPAMCELLGRPAEDVIGHSIVDFTHPGDVEHSVETLAELMQGETRTITLDKRYVRPDGTELWAQVSTALVRDGDGEPVSFIKHVLDITERKRAEEALRASERMYAEAYERERAAAERLRGVDEMKNMFLSAVSHELRTPLTAVIGFSETLTERHEQLSAEERGDMLRRLRRSARKLEHMLSDLLDLDRLGRGIIESRRRPTEMATLIDRVITENEPADAGRVIVDVEPITADIDAAHVERILENLISNAVRHTPPGTPIWVRAKAVEDGVQIQVDDAGPGVPEHLRPVMFEPFRRGPDAPAHSPGVGIGLSLVDRFTALHGGRVWIADREGGGASFRVFLPARVEQASRKRMRLGRLRSIGRDRAADGAAG